MKRLVFATNNAHKLSEVRAMVGDTFEILSLEDLDCHDDIPETADTLSGNALMKAEYIAEKYHVNCFADDTGLVVDALGGAPGVHTARYAFPDRHDPVANTKKLLAELQGQPDRRAAFITAIALIIDGQKHLFEGRVDGFIATEERGSEGFGYDAVFIPEDTGKTFAELGVDAKNKISHRARAIAKLCTFLKGKPAAC
ncbi:MAG: non-canonical purine NTP diphosphatase [Alloprevotella sp.]|nr:non-canonical purine NTP diphosphatase [Alloprevotella sp.]